MRFSRLLVLVLALFFMGSIAFSSQEAQPVVSSPGRISFASYAYFIDKLQFPVKKIGYVFATPQSVYEGPFHTNDELHIYLPPRYFEEDHLPFFRGEVTTAAKSIVYYNQYGPFDEKGNLDSRRFHMIFRDGVKIGVQPIPLPEDPEKLDRENALAGFTLPKRSQDFVFLPHDSESRLTGGIVANGDIQELTFASVPEKIAKLTFQKRKRSVTVVVNFQDNATLLTDPDGKVEKFQGIPNGAIYIQGSLGNMRQDESGLHGTVRGRWTLACEGDLFIPDSLLYSDTPAGSQPTGGDLLALIAPNVFVSRKAPDLLFLYATLFVGKKETGGKSGTFLVLPNLDSPHQGQLIWWGNYAGVYPAVMGRFDRLTGLSTDGYDLHKFYDARLAKDPPPFFPDLDSAEVGAAK